MRTHLDHKTHVTKNAFEYFLIEENIYHVQRQFITNHSLGGVAVSLLSASVRVQPGVARKDELDHAAVGDEVLDNWKVLAVGFVHVTVDSDPVKNLRRRRPKTRIRIQTFKSLSDSRRRHFSLAYQ